jgi:hypothetical protein
MARRADNPYEQAKLTAQIEAAGVKSNPPLGVGVTYPFIPQSTRVKNVKDINPMRSYRGPLEGDGDYLEVDSQEYYQALQDPLAPADLFSGSNAGYVDIPTSTTNVRRPRTVAAGYAPDRLGNGQGILTVVFRDGTVWNYYGKDGKGVTPGEWLNFKGSISKGKPWINEKVFGHGEPANTEFIDPQIRARVYEAAREYQLQSASVKRYRAPGQSPRTKARAQRVGKTAARSAQAQFRGTSRKKGGTNPSTNGKNPNQ